MPSVTVKLRFAVQGRLENGIVRHKIAHAMPAPAPEYLERRAFCDPTTWLLEPYFRVWCFEDSRQD